MLDLRVHRLGFPEPVGRKGRTLIWSWAQVEQLVGPRAVVAERGSSSPTCPWADAVASRCCRSPARPRRRGTRPARTIAVACECPASPHLCLPRAGVALVTVVLRAADADLTVAALVYIVVVVLTALLGYWAGAVGAVLSYLALNYWFIPKYESFTFSKPDDFVPLARLRPRGGCGGRHRRPGQRTAPARRGARTRRLRRPPHRRGQRESRRVPRRR